jgi:serine/threonine-protein kinase
VRDLDHPGIVKLEAEYLDSAIPFLQYEFIEGVDLSKLLDERSREDGGGPLRPDHAAALILKLVDIVAVPHSRRLPIVHKDLKPQNILVSNYHDLRMFTELGVLPDLRLANLKVMDFGIGAHSRNGHGVTTGSQSIGREFEGFRTLAYASPQQSMGLPAHESDDVFCDRRDLV